MPGYAVKRFQEPTQEWRCVDDASWCEVDETFMTDEPAAIPDKPNDCCLWNKPMFRWDEDAGMKAAQDAEVARMANIDADVETTNAMAFLRDNDANAIKAWINTNVTDIASARTLLIRLSLVLAKVIKATQKQI